MTNIIADSGNCIDWIVLGDAIAVNLADLYLLVGLILVAVQLFKWLIAGSVKESIIGIMKQ
ncbi:MAG: hypothetical protein PWR12_100 [Eubacteriaceae bacterium]|nr:hypothetical protein [Eubacteriaceae bacterium]MDK2935546.1 hypothetical protein [Eubacteriaceae bacterium]